MWVNASTMAAINAAIKRRTGATSDYDPSAMPAAIRGIRTSPIVGSKAITLNGTYNALDDGFDCYSTVTVNVPTTSPSSSSSTVTPGGPYSIYDTTTTLIAASAYESDAYLTSAVFTAATEVGSYAFMQCTSLAAIEMSRCVSIGFQAFTGCYSLRSVSLPLCLTIDGCAFNYCSSLSSVQLPSCTFIGHFAFGDCSNLSYVSLPQCTRVGHDAFCYCSSLTSINLPACTILDYGAFNGCSHITSISLPVCTSIGSYAFMGCYNLISLYLTSVSQVPTVSENTFDHTPIGGYSTVAGQYGSVFVPSSLYDEFVVAPVWSLISSRITTIEGVPSSSSSQPVTPSELYSIYDTTTLAVQPNAYANDVMLTAATFMSAGTVGDYAFYGCTELSTVAFPACSSFGSSAFDGCSKLMSVDLWDNVSHLSIPKSAFAGTPMLDNTLTGAYGSIYVSPMLYNDTRGTSFFSRVVGDIPNPIVPDMTAHTSPYSINDPSATYVPSDAYSHDDNLTAVSLPKVMQIGCDAFAWCSGLTTLSLPECRYVGWISNRFGLYAFAHAQISSLRLPKALIVHGFDTCSLLTSISLPNVTDVKGFASCGITTLNLPKAQTIDGFDDCSLLRSLSLPEAGYVGGFRGCALQTVSLPMTRTVDALTFDDCQELTTVNLPNCNMIYTSMKGCYSLSNLYIGQLTQVDFLDDIVYERANNENYVVLTIRVPSDYVEDCRSTYADYSSRVKFAAV